MLAALVVGGTDNVASGGEAEGCWNCQSPVPAAATVCHQCGAQLALGTDPPSASDMPCRTCGEATPFDALFCGNCGTRDPHGAPGMEIDASEPEIAANLVDARELPGRPVFTPDRVDRTQLSPVTEQARQSLPTPPARPAEPMPSAAPAPAPEVAAPRPADVQPSDKITVIDPEAKADPAPPTGARRVKLEKVATRPNAHEPLADERLRKRRTEQQTTKTPRALLSSTPTQPGLASKARTSPPVDPVKPDKLRITAAPRPGSKPPGARPDVSATDRVTEPRAEPRAQEKEEAAPARDARPTEVDSGPKPAAKPRKEGPDLSPPEQWPDLTEDLAEIRFFLLQGLEEEARSALRPLADKYPGHPEIEAVLAEVGGERAEAPADVDDEAQTLEPRPGAKTVIDTASASAPALNLSADDDDDDDDDLRIEADLDLAFDEAVEPELALDEAVEPEPEPLAITPTLPEPAPVIVVDEPDDDDDPTESVTAPPNEDDHGDEAEAEAEAEAEDEDEDEDEDDREPTVAKVAPETPEPPAADASAPLARPRVVTGPAPEAEADAAEPADDAPARRPKPELLHVPGEAPDVAEVDRRVLEAEAAEAELSRREEERREGARRAARAEASARRVTAEEREKIELAQRAADKARDAEAEADEAERIARQARERATKAREEARRAARAAEEASRAAKRAAVSRKVKAAVAEAAKEAEEVKAHEVARAAEAARLARAAVADAARQASTTGPSQSVPVGQSGSVRVDGEIEVDPSLEIDARSLLHPSLVAALDPYDEDEPGAPATVDSGRFLGAPEATPLQDSALPLLEVDLDDDRDDTNVTKNIDTGDIDVVAVRGELEDVGELDELDEIHELDEIEEIVELRPESVSVVAPSPEPTSSVTGGEIVAVEDLEVNLDDLDELAPDPGPARTGKTIPPGTLTPVPAQSGNTVVGEPPSAPVSVAPSAGTLPRTTVVPTDTSRPASPRPFHGSPEDDAAASGEFSFPESTEPQPPPMPQAVAQTPDGTVISPLAGSKAAVPVAAVRLVALGAEGEAVAEQRIEPGEEFEIGRAPGTPWAADGNMHGRHVRVRPGPGGIVLHELGEACAVYTQVVERSAVRDGDELKVGQSALYYAKLPEGTDAGVRGSLAVYKPRSDTPEQYPVGGAGLRLGRDDGDIVFPDDTYVSGNHCRFLVDGSEVFVEDLGSSNGTYLRVRSGGALGFGALMLVGHTQFRILPG